MKKRTELGYRDTQNKDGGIQTKFEMAVAQRVIKYCKKHNLNKTRFVESCVVEKLDYLEKQELMEKSKEELIEMYCRLKNQIYEN